MHGGNHKLNGLPQCLRWGMFTLNVLLFISSALTLGYASYLLSSKWNLLASDNIIPIVMFILFGILLIVSCLGSVATCRLSRPLLLIYSAILIICFLLQIIIIILIIVSTNITTENWLENRWNDLSETDRQWIESELKCCGFNQNETDTNNGCNYTDYCETKLKIYLNDLHLIAIILGVIIIIFEICGVIVSCILIRGLNEQIEKVRNESYIEYSYMDEPKNDHYRI
eukprot:469349_1